MPVYDILYKPDFTVIKPAPHFRWIHLPSNNVAWAEALITKLFLERGATDVGSFKAMLQVFGQQQHRGPKVHSRFMRPLCQRIWNDHAQSNPGIRPKSTHQSSSKCQPPLKNQGDSKPASSSIADGVSHPTDENVVVLFVSLVDPKSPEKLN